MKKAVSILLAFVFALACAMPAFAVDDPKYKCGVCNTEFYSAEELDNHYIKCHSSQPTTAYLVCPYCDNRFSDEDSFNDHIVICADQQRAGSGDFSITSMLDRMISVYETTASWWDAIEDVIIRLFDVFEDIFILLLPPVDAA